MVEAREVRPKKTELEVADLSVVWIPFRTGDDGVPREAWRDTRGAA